MIWIGDGDDARMFPDRPLANISAVLNCAFDLNISRDSFSEGVEYSQIGLVDGPGSNIAVYHAAALKLCSLIRDCRTVLVHDHDAGSRAATVIIMALHTLRRRGWDHWLGVIREKTGRPEFEPHPEHKRVFNRINWRLLSSVIG